MSTKWLATARRSRRLRSSTLCSCSVLYSIGIGRVSLASELPPDFTAVVTIRFTTADDAGRSYFGSAVIHVARSSITFASTCMPASTANACVSAG